MDIPSYLMGKSAGGSGGTSDYSDLTNKPSINGVTLSGNKTSADLGISGGDSGVVINYSDSNETNLSILQALYDSYITTNIVPDATVNVTFSGISVPYGCKLSGMACDASYARFYFSVVEVDYNYVNIKGVIYACPIQDGALTSITQKDKNKHRLTPTS